MKIILASKSPRRRELLEQIGLEFTCMVSDKEEVLSGNTPKEVVESLSLQKAEDVYGMVKDDGEDHVIIGADTVVALGQELMGKPRDEENAKQMLKALSGSSHSVWTGVTLITTQSGEKRTETFAVETKVYMYDIADREIEEYVAGGEPMDKAGGYAIQGMGAKFIRRIEGDYNNVVGLPVAEVWQRLKG